jgi:outer membrane protein
MRGGRTTGRASGRDRPASLHRRPGIRRLARAVLAVCAALAAALPAFPFGLAAQEPAALRLSLDDALRMAEGSNPAYRRATNDALLNGIEMRTTWLDQLLPTPTLQLNTAYTGNLQRFGRDDYGNPIEKESADWVYASSTSQYLNLAWDISGPSNFQAHRRQSLVNAGRDLAQATALTAVQVEVRLLYMDALEQRELMESEEELLEGRRVDQGVAERLFSLGVKTPVEVLRAEFEVEQQSLALQRQRAAYQTALLELRAALGTDEGAPIELVSEPLPVFDPASLDTDALLSRARDVNPRLRAADVGVATADVEAAQARGMWWPQISVGLDVYKRAQAFDGGGALFDPALDQGLESYFFIRMSLPVFSNFFGLQQQRERATVALRNEVETGRETQLDVERAVRIARLTLQNEHESVRIAERSSEIAGEALRLARERYRLGTGTFEELRASAVAEAGARRQLITARHAFVEALLRLEEAVGEPVRPASASGR